MKCAKFNKLKRRKTVEALWDTYLYYVNTGERLLEETQDVNSTQMYNLGLTHVYFGGPTLNSNQHKAGKGWQWSFNAIHSDHINENTGTCYQR